jgi:hypothetical protein
MSCNNRQSNKEKYCQTSHYIWIINIHHYSY